MDWGWIMEPDYLKYSLDELSDVQNNIDVEVSPQWYAKIAIAIDSKLNGPIEVKVHETTKHKYRLWAALLVTCVTCVELLLSIFRFF